MAFFISTRDAHISPRAKGPRANMGRGLIWQHAHSRTVVRVSRRIKILHVYIERTLRACT